jgi:hypothetical protein
MSAISLSLKRPHPLRRTTFTTARSARLVEWQTLPGSRLGTVNGQIAGTVVRRGIGYHVVDWAGEKVGWFPTLASAQRALEPSGLLGRRESLYGRSTHGEAVIAAVVSSAAVAFGITAGVLLINAPL